MILNIMSKLINQICHLVLSTGDVNLINQLVEHLNAIHEGTVKSSLSLKVGNMDIVVPTNELPSDSLYDIMVHTINMSYILERNILKPKEVVEMTQGIMMPKYDGCNCTVTITCNGDVIAATKHGKNNLMGDRVKSLIHEMDFYSVVIDKRTNHFNLVFSDLSTNVFNLGESKDNDLVLNPISSITMNGEIVLKQQVKDVPSAAFVSGKVNGKQNVWNEAKSVLEFIPYEIITMDFIVGKDLVEFIPTQIQTILILTALGFKQVYSIGKVNTSTVTKMFHKLNGTMEPMDGIVYCPLDWTHGSSLNKYAWKYVTSFKTKVTGIEYTLGITGLYSTQILFEPFTVEGRTISCAKIPTSLVKIFHNGMDVIVELHGGIPQIVCVNGNSDKHYSLIKSCKYCKSKLSITSSSKKPVSGNMSYNGKEISYIPQSVMCNNGDCPELNTLFILQIMKNIKMSHIISRKNIKCDKDGIPTLGDTLCNHPSEDLVREKIFDIPPKLLFKGLSIRHGCLTDDLLKGEMVSAFDEVDESQPLSKITKRFLIDLCD